MAEPVKLEWRDWGNASLVEEHRREEMAQEVYGFCLAAPPGKVSTYRASTGDTVMLGTVDEDGTIEIEDLKRRRSSWGPHDAAEEDERLVELTGKELKELLRLAYSDSPLHAEESRLLGALQKKLGE